MPGKMFFFSPGSILYQVAKAFPTVEEVPHAKTKECSAGILLLSLFFLVAELGDGDDRYFQEMGGGFLPPRCRRYRSRARDLRQLEVPSSALESHESSPHLEVVAMDRQEQ